MQAPPEAFDRHRALCSQLRRAELYYIVAYNAISAVSGYGKLENAAFDRGGRLA
jgi:hypothetical protein